jgi:hypothetical protein
VNSRTAISPLIRQRFPTGDVWLSHEEVATIRALGIHPPSQWLPAGMGEIAIAYGAYVPQIGVPQSDVLAAVTDALGRGLGYVFQGVVHTLELVDCDVIPDGRAVGRATIAALVRIDSASSAYLRAESGPICAFLRYDTNEVGSNIVNRPGVFVLRTLSGTLTRPALECWRDRVNPQTAKRVAAAIKLNG